MKPSFERYAQWSAIAGIVTIMVGPVDNVAAQSDVVPTSAVPWEVAAPVFFAVSVADLDQSTEWYGRVLGLVPVRDVASRDGRSQARVLRRDNIVVELISFSGSVDLANVLGPEMHRFMMQGPVKVGIYVQDIGAVRDWLTYKAVDMDAQVGVDAILGVRTFVFRDLDDNRIQVFEVCESECGEG